MAGTDTARADGGTEGDAGRRRSEATAVRANETTVPLLPCVSAEETLEFYRALGFEAAYEQTRPYLYLAFRWSGFDLHYGRAPKGLDPALENSGGCLVMVDAVAPYHAALTQAMRRAYGRVLAKGLPRITRHRPGASRFTLMDPSGNSVVFIQRGEPERLEYGGAKDLNGLARVLDGARILRDFKADDLAAFRRIRSGLKRHGDRAPAVERALALAMLVELAVALGEEEGIEEWRELLGAIPLTGDELGGVEGELRNASALRHWLGARTPEADGD
ncbi:glyoxalase [Nocardiopsis sp. HUAS JQ3]|uniref:glyoxalase n=1 Tax=Nocardiopsis sp. HUAS JQ3 TaxID=3061629 RepID=UPI0023A93E9B|nr:glyoxalase [Nocardiopsis sp. HUAS JQ3]WDZ89373.1 glyoxalase [Nocardiopsis sp. HUAS JQ3]